MRTLLLSVSALIEHAYEAKPDRFVYPAWMDEARYDLYALTVA